ncbi:MAG: hypothetical protein RR131_02050 [Anaerovorax sp.]
MNRYSVFNVGAKQPDCLENMVLSYAVQMESIQEIWGVLSNRFLRRDRNYFENVIQY